MRILVDTNVLFSALLFPNSRPAAALCHVAEHHSIILCEQNISELHEILERKAPKYLPAMEEFLARLSYELIPMVKRTGKRIRDVSDQSILNAAIVYDVDIILTGDKDFLALDIERPKCMTVAEFIEKEGINEG